MALRNKKAYYPGGGRGVWSNIHILVGIDEIMKSWHVFLSLTHVQQDLARLYVVVLETWLNSPEKVETGRRGYIFSEDGTETTWGECVAHVGRILHQRGVLSTAETSQLPEDLIRKTPMGRGIYSESSSSWPNFLLRSGCRWFVFCHSSGTSIQFPITSGKSTKMGMEAYWETNYFGSDSWRNWCNSETGTVRLYEVGITS